MINNDRIVPIQKIDFISMIGTILRLSGLQETMQVANFEVLKANDVNGNFSVTGTGALTTPFLANQPVKTCDFADGVTAGVVLFVPAFDYEGFTVAGAAATYAEDSETVNPDGITLYIANLQNGSVTINAVTPVLE